MGHEFNSYIRDLQNRQNKNVTSAQLHDMENTKKYTMKDLDAFVKETKDKSFVRNASNPSNFLWNFEESKLCKLLSKQSIDDLIPENKILKQQEQFGRDRDYFNEESNDDYEKELEKLKENNTCKISAGFNDVTILAPDIKETKTNDIRDILITSKTNKSTITQMQLLDIKRIEFPQKIRIVYPAGLLDEFILEYQKIIKWLEDNHFDVLTLLGLNNEIHISQLELENEIRFLEKMKLLSEEK